MENLLREEHHTRSMTAEAGGPAMGSGLRPTVEAVCSPRRLVVILDRWEWPW